MSAAPPISGTTECSILVSGHRIRYLRAGSGPPMLLIHGLLGYSFSWRFNFPELGRIRDVVAPDMLGTGFSDRPNSVAYDVEACAKRMLDLMDVLAIDQFDLLGTSHGGGVAVMMAAVAPHRVRSLILSAPVNPWSSHGQFITRLLAKRLGNFVLRTAAPLIEALGHYWLARMYGDPRRIPNGTVEGYMAPMKIAGIWDYSIAIVRAWQKDLQKLETAYARVRCPTLLVWGDKDPAVFPSSAKQIQQRIPGARLELIRGTGHLPYEEAPAAFNSVVCRFLERATGAG